MLNRSFYFAASILTLFIALTMSLFAQESAGPVPRTTAIDQRVDAMLAKMTLEQKLELIGGEEDMFIRAVPAAGFPALKMSDGPDGVRTWGPDTAYAGGIALAATWDPDLAQRMGVSIAQDARARGVHFLLGPGVNIYRAPMSGRNFEYFGEDPFLAAHTAVPYIEGVQSQGVIATVKHYAANNQEYDRHNVSSDLDERTLREIYLPAFEAAVKVANVGSVMNSYNLVNGVHATQNNHLNNEILKKEWGFAAYSCPTGIATYDAVGAANGGLDLEMPNGEFMNPKNLLPAVKSGKVSEATIDDKVRRIFRTAIRFGFLDRDQTDLSIPYYNLNGKQVALEEARESVILLKNEGNLLPLDGSKVKTLAVIGPDAWPEVAGAGGSSRSTPYASISIMTGLANLPNSQSESSLRPRPADYQRTSSSARISAASPPCPQPPTPTGKTGSASPASRSRSSTTPTSAAPQPCAGRRTSPHRESEGMALLSKAAPQSIRYTADYLPKNNWTIHFCHSRQTAGQTHTSCSSMASRSSDNGA